MRIAVYYDLAPGGAAFALARFVAHLRRGHSVAVIAPRGAWPLPGGVEWIGEAPRPLPGALYYARRFLLPRRLAALARAEEELAGRLGAFDRVLVHACRERGAPALLSMLGGRAQYYVTEPLRLYREPRPQDALPEPLWRAARAIYAPISRRLNAEDTRHARAAGTLIANSDYTRLRVAEVYGREAVVAPPSLDPFYLEAPPGAGDGGFVLSPGALIPQKGHGRVIRALATWPSPPPLVVAGFHGRTGYAHRLQRLAARHHVPLRVVRDLDPETLRRLLGQARVVAIAAVREPFGLVSLEAQAAGRPVVVVDEGGLPETVAPGETGLVAAAHGEEFSEALHALWADGPRQERMGARGRERVAEMFSPERCGARLEEALR